MRKTDTLFRRMCILLIVQLAGLTRLYEDLVWFLSHGAEHCDGAGGGGGQTHTKY